MLKKNSENIYQTTYFIKMPWFLKKETYIVLAEDEKVF